MRPLYTSRSREAARIAETLARLAVTELPVLLEGETGTGKSFVASRLHRASRPRHPLVVVDCGSLPASLLPAELFGHTSGAFTDATSARQGLLARAGEGTLVLDRVDALPLESQAVLLRVIEERRFTPVGASASRPFQARFVTLADAGLRAKLDAGSFRMDLYQRLAGMHTTLLPLRHRSEDILPFARAALRRHGGRDLVLDPEAAGLLEAYPWPGNFRELDTLAARTSLLVRQGPIRAADLDLPAEGWPGMAELAAVRELPLAAVERLYALHVLARHHGNVTRAAAALGVSRRTLIRWRGPR